MATDPTKPQEDAATKEARMERAKVVSKLDQASAFVVETMPGFWWALFQKCKAEGFDESQALQIVKAHIFSMGTGPRQP